ncbi:MAG: TIM barrel protein [Candidatus Scalindua sp.]|nr:TIM barrel protein [Candidatus Scalindua sp.]
MKQIRIGNQTSFSAQRPLLPFEFALEKGFDAFEWFPDKKEWGAGWDTDDINGEMRQHINRKATNNDIALSVHAPWYFNPLEHRNPALLFKEIEFARDIGAYLLIIHLAADKGVENYVNAIIPLIRDSSEKKLLLSIENTPLTDPEVVNRTFGIIQNLKNMPTQHVGMCLDLGHANLCTSTRNDYLRFVDQLEPEVPINHVHLHENYGDSDSHLPVFTGPSRENDSGICGLIKRLKNMHFSGSIILEQWPEPPSLLTQARERLYHLWNNIPDTPSPFSAPDVNNRLKSADETVMKDNHVPDYKRPGQPDIKGLKDKGDAFINSIVEADGCYRSWREKLNWVASLFHDTTLIPDTVQLIYLSIYLRFLGTGELACHEDGRHFRPHHHAETAHHIEKCLRYCTTRDNTYIMRKIYPWLPSYDNAFMRAEPLTRIRDIAHRNDISKELKNEIKHTLQNKLHRCAGPEDLRTSAALLERITAENADYPSSFVEEFKIFHQELKEFFNASGLEEVLESLINKEDMNTRLLIQNFLDLKRKPEETSQHYVTLLKLLTELRNILLRKANDAPGAEAQQFRLADIRLEDFLFLLLSEFLNILENRGEKDIDWTPILETLLLTVINLTMTTSETEECEIIQSELAAWKDSFMPTQIQMLRLRATLERCRRLCEDYTDRVLNHYHTRVETLGRLLGVREQAIQFFCEGDIRGNTFFQFSKLVSFLLKQIRKSAGLSSWDAIVTGNAAGLLIPVDSLDDVIIEKQEGVILLAKRAEGDEIIPENVSGILLGHQLPHLSHLGVRARQDGVIFATCEDEGTFRALDPLTRQQINCTITAEDVHCEAGKSVKTDQIECTDSGQFSLPETHVILEQRCLSMDQVNSANGGAKANGAKLLEELSSRHRSAFKTPSSLVIPFGVMEESLRISPILGHEYQSLLDTVSRLSSDIITLSARLRKILSQITVHNKIIDGIKNRFPEHGRVIVRSSSNCEDTVEMSGAGLFDSIANVPLTKIAISIRHVWASLWSKRAVSSLKSYRIPHDKVHMALIIQQMLTPDFSFIMHTVNPITQNRDEVYIELAVGLGESLASGVIKGTPYRMICNKKTLTVQMLAFANFSFAIVPDHTDGVCRKRTDYSMVPLSTNTDIHRLLGNRLTAIGQLVEESFGKPQDIEGAIVGDDVYLVQTRMQQGIMTLRPSKK